MRILDKATLDKWQKMIEESSTGVWYFTKDELLSLIAAARKGSRG